ncbi:MAG: exodeoxyribonuclease VII large subunit [Nitrospirales bacterium]
MPTTGFAVLTVTELTTQIRLSLEQAFPELWVQGEVSNLRTPSSGHLYFTLKDQTSQIRAVLFRGVANQLRFALRDGLQVIVRGRLNVYEVRGDYQIILEYLEPKGIGAFQLAFEQLKEKLEREGLFDSARKRPLPFFPRKVGIVTSPSGAAIQDMLTIMKRRCPVLSVLIYPVAVQGEGAAEQIAEAIAILGRKRDVEVIIVGRGGGSLEDLWCFNEEIVVRAIAESKVPVVSAVGHEIDFTLADFAADYRAPTPSAAAEVVSPVLGDLIESIVSRWDRLVQHMQGKLTVLRHRVQMSRREIPDPMRWVYRQAQRLDDLNNRLRVALRIQHSNIRPRLLALSSALTVHSPQARIGRALVLVPQLLSRLKHAILGSVGLKRHVFQSRLSGLNTLNPLAILSRGYSVIESLPEGFIVKNAKDVSPGSRIRARLAEGQLSCVVDEVRTDP